MVDLRTSGGRAAIAGALLALAGNAWVLAADPAGPDGLVSSPLTVGAFRWGQIFFAVTQALMAAGVLALVLRSPGGRPGVFGWLAVAGLALTVPGELALIPVASSAVDSAPASAASTFFGVAVLLTDVGLIGFGIREVRRRRGSMALRWLPVVFGLFQLLVVTPVSLAAGFASTASFVVIALADLLFAAIGVALLRERAVRPARLAAVNT